MLHLRNSLVKTFIIGACQNLQNGGHTPCIVDGLYCNFMATVYYDMIVIGDKYIII